MSCREKKPAAREGFLLASSNINLRKALWSPEEDQKLLSYLNDRLTLGCSWTSVAKQAGLQRCGKSCRRRWVNYLRPGLNRGAFSREEERLIINSQSILGNRWSQIALHLPGRTDNQIKNYCHSCTNKKGKPNTDAMPEGHPTPYNTSIVGPTPENQFCGPGLLELRQVEGEHQKNEISHPISYFQNNINTLYCDAAFTGSTEIPMPAVAESESSKKTVGYDGWTTNDNTLYCDAAFMGSTEIPMPAVAEIESSKKTVGYDGWTTTDNSYSNAYTWSHVVDPGAFTVHKTGISVAEDSASIYENTTRFTSHFQFDSPAIKWLPGKSNDFQVDDDHRDRLNLSSDVNTVVQTYPDIYSYQLPKIQGGVTNRQDCLLNSYQENKANPICTIPGGRRSGPGNVEGNIGTDYATLSADTAAASDLYQILCHFDQNLF